MAVVVLVQEVWVGVQLLCRGLQRLVVVVILGGCDIGSFVGDGGCLGRGGLGWCPTVLVRIGWFIGGGGCLGCGGLGWCPTVTVNIGWLVGGGDIRWFGGGGGGVVLVVEIWAGV